MIIQPDVSGDETEPDFVHTGGSDCPCGPTSCPAGIVHHGQVGRVEVLVNTGDDENW